MKNLLKIFFNDFSTVIIVIVVLCCSKSVSAQENITSRNDNLDDMSFLEMLYSVPTDKSSKLIQKFQDKEAKGQLLKNTRFGPKGKGKVELYKNKEVILVTIPADELFGPNSTELLEKASGYLSPIKRYLKNPDTYRVLLVMHTDNTGSEEYRDKLTIERVDAVFDWFEESGADTSFLFSYAMSDDMPLAPNTSMDNRRNNRRLEIYLMPGQKMIEQANKGNIAF